MIDFDLAEGCFDLTKCPRDRWVDVGTDRTGTQIAVMVTSDNKRLVKKTIPPQIVAAAGQDAAKQREFFKKGCMLGNTQKHWMPAARLPWMIYDDIKQKYGTPSQNPRKWSSLLNNEFAAFKSTEMTI